MMSITLRCSIQKDYLLLYPPFNRVFFRIMRRAIYLPSFLQKTNKDENEMHQAELSLKDQRAHAVDALQSVFGDREVEHFKKYIELIPSYARKVDSYTEKLLSMQRMENEVELAAAHERTDIEVTEEDRLKDDAIMKDDSEWM